MTTKAIQNELAEVTEYSFEYDGYTYTVDKDMLTDLDVLEAFEEDKVLRPVRLILGEKQWSMFRSKKRKASDLEDLCELLFKEAGATLGE